MPKTTPKATKTTPKATKAAWQTISPKFAINPGSAITVGDLSVMPVRAGKALTSMVAVQQGRNSSLLSYSALETLTNNSKALLEWIAKVSR